MTKKLSIGFITIAVAMLIAVAGATVSADTSNDISADATMTVAEVAAQMCLVEGANDAPAADTGLAGDGDVDTAAFECIDGSECAPPWFRFRCGHRGYCNNNNICECW